METMTCTHINTQMKGGNALSIFSKDASTTVASENNYFNQCEINFLMLDHSKEAFCDSLVHSYTAG